MNRIAMVWTSVSLFLSACGGQDTVKKELAAPCSNNADCLSGSCLPFEGGAVCSISCATGQTCPGGTTCANLGSVGSWCLPGSCTPACAGRQCGPDGCAGSCGSCSGGKGLCQDGQCQCDAHASKACKEGNVWWFDSCGNAEELFLTCPEGCEAGLCQNCVADCADKDCGADGCGGDCGACNEDESCSQAGLCEDRCRVGFAWCGSECVDLSSDSRHCGTCNHRCDAGQTCEGSNCAAAADCRVTPCAGFSYCDLASGECKPGCAFDDQCDAHQRCEVLSHGCVCADDQACDPGQICEGAKCIKGCRQSGDCPLEQLCNDLLCVPGCDGDARCPSDKVCRPSRSECIPGCRFTSMTEVSAVDLESFGISWTFIPNMVAVFDRTAYLGDSGSSSVVILDLSDPRQPSFVNSFDTGYYWINTMEVAGDKLFVNNGELNVYSLAQPTAPQLLGSHEPAVGGYEVFEIAGNRAYLVAMGCSPTGNGGVRCDPVLEILDISNPGAISLLSTLPFGTDYDSNPYAIALLGSHVLVALAADGGSPEAVVEVVDVADEAHPLRIRQMTDFITLSTLQDLDGWGTHAFGITDDEIGVVIDLGDPLAPKRVTTFAGAGTNQTIFGDHLYIGAAHRLDVYNIQEPADPFLVGSETVFTSAAEVVIRGSFAYVANYGYGLTIIQLPACAVQGR